MGIRKDKLSQKNKIETLTTSIRIAFTKKISSDRNNVTYGQLISIKFARKFPEDIIVFSTNMMRT